MSEKFMEEDVKTRLILSGVKELSENGARDFSLRRSAEGAGVSCAAPYRYFKSKEEYIAAVISYLLSRWGLMANEISKAHKGNWKTVIAELSVSNIMFWLSNKNLRTALILSGEENSLVKPSAFDGRLTQELRAYLNSRGISEKEIESKVNAHRALVLGYVTLIGSGELKADAETYGNVKRSIENSL